MKNIIITKALGLILCVCFLFSLTVQAKVYLNRKVLDCQHGIFEIGVPLDLEGESLTLTSGYQNEYGNCLGLPAGPPFYVEAPINVNTIYDTATGEIEQMASLKIGDGWVKDSEDDGSPKAAFELIFMNDNCNLNANGGNIKIMGTPLNPVYVSGVQYRILSGYRGDIIDPVEMLSELPTATFKYCVFSNPEMPPGGGALLGLSHGFNSIENCMFSGLDNCKIEAGLNGEIIIRNNIFNDIYYQTGPVRIAGCPLVTIENNSFTRNKWVSHQAGGVIEIDGCGIKSIKDNAGGGNTIDAISMKNCSTAVDSTHFQCTYDLPIKLGHNVFTVGLDQKLYIANGSMIKLPGIEYASKGSIESTGEIEAYGTVFTSWEDTVYGENVNGGTDYLPDVVGTWGGIRSTNGVGSLTLKDCKIRYSYDGISSRGNTDVDSLKYEFNDGWFWCYGGGGKHSITNSKFKNNNQAIYVNSSNGAFFDFSMDNVEIAQNTEAMDIRVTTSQTVPTRISINDCQFEGNDKGIIFQVAQNLDSLKITNSIISGNAYYGIYGQNTSSNTDNVRVNIESCVIAGNGQESNTNGWLDGVKVEGGNTRFVNNTVAYNNQHGLWTWVNDIGLNDIANNIFYRNGEYGIYKHYDVDLIPEIVTNTFWENDDTNELYFNTSSGILYSVAEIQALGGEYATNRNSDPGFKPEITGTITTVDYNESSRLSVLVCDSLDLGNNYLKYAIVNPDTTQDRWFSIHHSYNNTLYIKGDVVGNGGAEPGDVFKVFDHHLAPTSDMIDVGTNTFVTVDKDIDGDDRFIDGIPGGYFSVDIGADEFNPDSSSGDQIVVVTPFGGELWMPGEVRNIEWTSEGVGAVDIFWCDNWSNDWEPVWQEIMVGVSADESTYEWTIPEAFGGKCAVRLVSSSDTAISDMSHLFSIKGYVLARPIVGNDIEAFTPSSNGWQFDNSSLAIMWPNNWWYLFDYANGIDPYTGKVYPPSFSAPEWGINAIPSDFPDWPLFVNAFLPDDCYINVDGNLTYRLAAVLKWAAIKRVWAGSCFGLSQSSLMAFCDSSAFKDAFPGISPRDEIYTFSIDHEVRRGINRLHIYQYGVISQEHMELSLRKSPADLLLDCQNMLRDMSDLDNARAVTICDTSSVNNRGCHTMTPYKLEKVSEDYWALWVYDSNEPGDNSLSINVNTATNSWEYADQGWSGTWKAYLEDEVFNYTTDADFDSELKAGGNENRIEKVTTFIEVYTGLADTAYLNSDDGSIGRSGDSLFNTLTNGHAIVPKIGGPAKPIGYFIPNDNWTYEFSGMTDSVFNLSIFTDNAILYYNRLNVDSSDSEKFNYPDNENSLWVCNPDGSTRAYNMRVISTEAEEEHMFGVEHLTGSPGDSCYFGLTPQAGFIVGNYGQLTTYDIVLRLAGNSGEVMFGCDSIALPGNTSHHIIPNWTDLGNDSLKILIDFGNDGIWDDSIYVDNLIPTDVDDEQGSLLPYKFELSQNYPNPFNPVTNIEYSVPTRSQVKIEIYNILGQKIKMLVDETKPAGKYQIAWDGCNSVGKKVSTGIYFYRFQAGEFISTKKMLLLK